MVAGASTLQNWDGTPPERASRQNGIRLPAVPEPALMGFLWRHFIDPIDLLEFSQELWIAVVQAHDFAELRPRPRS